MTGTNGGDLAVLTTTIGAYPKPDDLPLPDWFRAPGGPDTDEPTHGWSQAMEALGPDAEAALVRATRAVIQDQIEAGVDIPTDGEVRRENYIHYHCRHLDGFDFERLVERDLRGGAYRARLPAIVGPIAARERFLPAEWRLAQSFTDRPLKVTMPGPMTIADTTADLHYSDPKRLGADLARALNLEVRALADAGCLHIQVDEPVFARKPDEALDYGMENLERVLHGCPERVTRTVHMCCGYPDRLDNPDYPKASPDSYSRLARAVDGSPVIDSVSIEDAHRHNDLSLLEAFPATTVIFGVVAVAKSRLESVEEIRERLRAALEHIDPHRLIAAPDCGLGLLGRDLARVKLRHMCEAAHSL